MVKGNQKGFSLVELMAVLTLFSVIIVPLLTSFTNSVTANIQSVESRKAVAIVEGSMYAINKIDFQKYRTALDNAYGGGANFLELNEDECATTFVDTLDQDICSSIFSMSIANMTLDATTFRVFLFDYNNTSAEFNTLINDGSLPEAASVQIENNDEINAAISPTDDIQSLIWLVTWVEYYDNPNRFLVNISLLSDENPQED